MGGLVETGNGGVQRIPSSPELVGLSDQALIARLVETGRPFGVEVVGMAVVEDLLSDEHLEAEVDAAGTQPTAEQLRDYTATRREVIARAAAFFGITTEISGDELPTGPQHPGGAFFNPAKFHEGRES